MRVQLILVIVQKTKGVELLYPAQHLCFYFFEVSNGEY
jgi:hypothetical protein